MGTIPRARTDCYYLTVISLSALRAEKMVRQRHSGPLSPLNASIASRLHLAKTCGIKPFRLRCAEFGRIYLESTDSFTWIFAVIHCHLQKERHYTGRQWVTSPIWARKW